MCNMIAIVSRRVPLTEKYIAAKQGGRGPQESGVSAGLAIIFIFIYVTSRSQSHSNPSSGWSVAVSDCVTCHFSSDFTFFSRFFQYFSFFSLFYYMILSLFNVTLYNFSLATSFIFVYVTSLSLSHSNPSSGWSVAVSDSDLSLLITCNQVFISAHHQFISFFCHPLTFFLNHSSAFMSFTTKFILKKGWCILVSLITHQKLYQFTSFFLIQEALVNTFQMILISY